MIPVPPVVIVAWLLGWLLLWRLPRLHRAPGGAPPHLAPTSDPTVSVVIPARNEADRLPLLLASLGGQTRPADEIIVVDDDSHDETAALAAAAPGTTVVPAPPLPEGWSGKTWACSTGAAAATGDVLVFLDADVTLAPDALACLLATMGDGAGLLSVQPHHVTATPVEAVSLPFNIVAMMGWDPLESTCRHASLSIL